MFLSSELVNANGASVRWMNGALKVYQYCMNVHVEVFLHSIWIFAIGHISISTL